MATNSHGFTGTGTATSSRQPNCQILDRDGAGQRLPAKVPVEQGEHLLAGDGCRVLEGGGDRVEVQLLDQVARLTRLVLRERDLGVVGQPHRHLPGKLHLDQVAAEQDPAPLVVQHAVPGEVAAGAVHGQPGRE
ncbi:MULTISPECIES: hypothetical protein [unclassified Micromonospora]|uniref:hypothetical protein n=1 Tax=unclassified Micromonospora TaxID=2617518 RepID=UPI001C21CAC3|nr:MULTISPECIES: hypothetical protein [unclassified Micromonospora]MBU8855825.1 hypothetical protein [Micromonospora sp. WMMB482]MBU8861845.1 hypothetical protein [Micromonospora sp. WMMB482]MDM4781425.1 hypothetical protein [Micromonospora sp. b486]